MEFKNLLEEISEKNIFCLNKRIKESLVQQGSIIQSLKKKRSQIEIQKNFGL